VCLSAGCENSPQSPFQPTLVLTRPTLVSPGPLTPNPADVCISTTPRNRCAEANAGPRSGAVVVERRYPAPGFCSAFRLASCDAVR
jgi:hypothetical protein